MTYIQATIFVEKQTQKAIVIGHKGGLLKKIGQSSREQLEGLLGTKVYLDLWVKVYKNWRRDARALRRLGYI
jgi:GTP-binding protein Era